MTDRMFTRVRADFETWTALGLLLFSILATTTSVAAETISSGQCTVRLLSQADRDELPNKYRDVIAGSFDRNREAIRNGLSLMPKLTCLAVQRVVFVNDPRYLAEDGWVLASLADLVFINYAGNLSSAKVSQTFIHESTHAADQLLNAHKAEQGLLSGWRAENFYPKGEADPEQWDSGARSDAQRVVKENRLGGGLRAEWVRLQRNFQAFGMAAGYLVPVEDEDGNRSLPTLADPATAGFMSRYGATEPGEDIAEFASWMIAASLFENSQAESDGRAEQDFNYHACRAMQQNPTESITKELAALFTKANFLLSTGLVTEEAYQRCVGKLKIRAPQPGMHVYGGEDGDAELMRSFTKDPGVSIGTHSKLEQYVFNFETGGRAPFMDIDYDVTLKLQLALGAADQELDQVSWPRGIYNLKEIGNKFDLLMPEQPAGTFAGIEGLVLVAHASNRKIEGSIFLRYAIRIHAPVPVPQTGLPLRFVFSISK